MKDHGAHPYNCSKYIICKGNVFDKEDNVWDYEKGNVYRPDNGQSDTLLNVPCAKPITGKLKYYQHNSN